MITIRKTLLQSPDEIAAFTSMLNLYATDIMGGSSPIAEDVLTHLPNALQGVEGKVLLLAYDNEKPVGVATSFLGFSTFNAKPLLNIHDLAVAPSHRGQGVGKLLLDRLQDEAIQLGCCKLTLEVLEGNQRARAVYHQFGFEGYELDPATGKALFFEKSL